MNQKITFINGLGQKRYCIFSPEKGEKEQWEEVLFVRKGEGFSVEVAEDKVRLVDYFHGETRAEFHILSKEETTEEITYAQNKAE